MTVLPRGQQEKAMAIEVRLRRLATMFDITAFTETILDGISCYCWTSHIGKHGSLSGGSTSFATRFKYLFPSSETHDGMVCEVPIPMVALVATAVSLYLCMCAGTLTKVISCMPRSTSGVLASNRSQNFLPTRIWMSIRVTSTLLNSFWRNGVVHSAP
jgi:hypothetical protein